MNDPVPTSGPSLPPAPVPGLDCARRVPEQVSDYGQLMADDDAARSGRSEGWPATIQSLLVTVVIALFIITFLLQAFRIPSPSMENTLLIGDHLLVDKQHFADGGMWGKILPYIQVRRGDIIVFHYPVDPSKHFVKRVIGVAGDRLRLVNGQLLLNGAPVNEKAYVIHRRADADYFRDNFPAAELAPQQVETRWWIDMHRYVRDRELIVPPGNYFAMGDNRDDSLDSRYWGFVPQESIIGRPLLIYWSFTTPWRGARAARAPDGTLKRFAYALTHPWEFTRWDRTLRLVK